LLNTLNSANLLNRIKRLKSTELALYFSEYAACQKALSSLAQPYLDELRKMVGETSNLVVLDGNEIIYVAQSESTPLLKLFTQLEAKVPFYCTVGGKATAHHYKKCDGYGKENVNVFGVCGAGLGYSFGVIYREHGFTRH